ncbi:hypothetical protein VZT92_017192 [Zoarces viviparus]|uniref:Ubiquitin-like domain-containing protein n=1 Tax=Zoarces viviparus TaxID=48416 RepID=A0AAW1EQ00_ZOAVI
MVVKLFIKDMCGRITEIDLSDSEFKSFTVLQLKTKIQEKTTRDGSQELIFKWLVLKDAAKLSDYGIQHKSTIHLGTQPVTIHFFIKGLDGRLHTFRLDEDEFKSCLLEHLKRRIQDTLGIPESQQILIFQGRELTENRFLPDYGIQNDSTIYLNLMLRGGGHCPETGDGGMGDKGGKNRSMEHLYYF